MGLFDIFKRPATPYRDEAINFVYELLFCDNPELYKSSTQQSDRYPWSVLFATPADMSALKKVATDPTSESRVRVLAYRRLLALGEPAGNKELLAVIVEVGLAEGLDTLAAFRDGTARYINHTGKLLVWEAADETSTRLISQLFADGAAVVSQIGPWDQPRRPRPAKGCVRISFLVADGLYFGEGPIDALFSDPLACPALGSATELMQYLVEQVSPE